jgi:hypothetical protein
MTEPKRFPSRDGCQCGGHACPRQYLAITGFILGTFLIVHLPVNMLGFWPSRFQAVVNRTLGLSNHALADSRAWSCRRFVRAATRF